MPATTFPDDATPATDSGTGKCSVNIGQQVGAARCQCVWSHTLQDSSQHQQRVRLREREQHGGDAKEAERSHHRHTGANAVADEAHDRIGEHLCERLDAEHDANGCVRQPQLSAVQR